MRHYSDDDLRTIVRQRYKGKSQHELAKELGISQTYLCHFLLGRNGAGPAILKALGFDETPYYRKAEK